MEYVPVMHTRLVALSVASLAPLLSVGLAHAQAPGEQLEADSPDTDAPEAPEAAPVVVAPAPVIVAPAPVIVAPAMVTPVAPVAIRVARRESVMDNRWAVGLSLGSMSLTRDGSDDKTAFAIGELAVRFRATPHLELELTAGGGRQQLDNGDQGDLEVNTAALALRYRFNPEGAWNWFVMGGLGGASVTFHDATDQERQDATHALGMLGVGVERRFHHFALQAELRGVSIADGHRNADKMVESTTAPSPASVKQTGGSLTIGGSYYF
ncbi:MAG TPA: outer membrane beta-barrel protein [Kofleriaceae bacterium]|nr:outer membrane beta-barrel protein [Kofleriaceae bacterium]